MLREAFKVLAAEGLIEISPNRGASVSRMTESEVWETFELMSGPRSFSGELACERITPAELAEIKALPLFDAGLPRAERPAGLLTAATRKSTTGSTKRRAMPRCARPTRSINRRLKALRFRSNHETDKRTARCTITKT
ncbi:hypothetical protein ACU4GD_21200 [Cupriavidus basilensis]